MRPFPLPPNELSSYQQNESQDVVSPIVLIHILYLIHHLHAYLLNHRLQIKS